MDISIFDSFPEEDATGPIQRAEGIFLAALCMVLQAKNIANIGYFQGHSAKAFLAGMPSDARLVSFDIAEDCVDDLNDSRHTLILKDQAALTPEDMPLPLELCLLDASHDFELNKATFLGIKDAFPPGGILLVHDTGGYNPSVIPASRMSWPYLKTDDAWYHRPEEVQFVQWVEETFKWKRIDLGSKYVLRHGLTLLQKPEERIIFRKDLV